MKPFMDENFLLQTESARTLYHDYAKKMPICDYHCHIVIQDIVEDKRYENLTQVWLSGDHYKWRAMRLNGIEERLITGDAPDYEKFLAYAATIAGAIGNPLYHWTHLELQRFFDIHEPLSEETAPAIWEKVNKILQSGLTCREMIRRSNVKTICTTDDPADDLAGHRALAEGGDFPEVSVLPSFRPDQALDVGGAGFRDYLRKLSAAAGIDIRDLPTLKQALSARLDFFDSLGCRVSDHALQGVPYAEATDAQVEEVLRAALAGDPIPPHQQAQYKAHLLRYLASLYAEKGMIFQLHIGALRRVNAAMTRQLGPDTGFDSIADAAIAEPLGRLLNSINEQRMPKTILYCLNPKDNYVLGAMLGNFADGGLAGKMQFGSAWWFNDHRDGMEQQMRDLANLGLLSRFVGMLTDSRSFTSYPRFEYFRRILCNLIGQWMEDGEIAPDMPRMGRIVEDICYHNIERLFQR